MAGEVEKLSGKLGIDTTDFKTALGAANRELRVLESGFKASAAALGDWTQDATGLEKRAISLTKQLDIQRAKVDALAAEHKRLAQENGAGSRAAQDAEIKLNKETETLNKMQTELTQTETSLQEMTTEEKKAGEAADDMGDQIDDSGSKMEKFQGVMKGIGTVVAGVVTALAALAAAAVAAAFGIAKIVFSAADAAGELVDLSTQTGISTTRLQEMKYVGDQVGTSLDTITGSQAKLIRSMDTAGEQSQDYAKKLAEAKAAGKDVGDIQLGDAANAFKILGVAVDDGNGHLRDSETVFSEVIDRLGSVENEAERDALAMQLFGKSAQELNPLIKAGSAELARLSQEAHDVGAVMSEEDVAGLEAFGDTVASIKAGVKGMLGTLAGQFLPIFKTIATAMQNLFKSEAFKKGIQDLSKAIQGFVTIVVDVITKLANGDLQGALAAIFGADRAEQLITFFRIVSNFISNVLIPFVQTHAQEIKAALIGIGAALAAAGIGGIIAGIVAAINPVTLIIAGIAAAIGVLSAAWAGNWGNVRARFEEVWAILQPALQQLWDWLSTNIPLALQALSGFWTGTLLPAVQAVWNFLEANLFPVLQKIGEFIGFILVADIQALSAIWTNVLLPALQAVWSFLQTYIFPLLQAIGKFISAVFSLYLRALAALWQNILLPALKQVYQYLKDNVFPLFQKLGDFISKTFQPVISALSTFLSNKLAPAFKAIADAVKGVIQWIATLADRLNNLELPAWLTPGSPTPWEIGLLGINDAMAELNKQLPTLAAGLNLHVSGSVPGIPGNAQQQGDNVQNDQFQFYAPVIVQGSTPAGSLGARLKGRRY
jgi:hypothetical protein